MKFLTPDARFGATPESLLARRERAAMHEGMSFGKDILSRELVTGLMRYISPDSTIVEVDAGPGHLTRVLLTRGARITALEPSPLFVRDLRGIQQAGENAQRLSLCEGFTEALPEGERYENALISFPARRGVGLLAQVNELAPLVESRILVVLPDDGSLDWAYLSRACALEGFEVRTEFHIDTKHDLVTDMKRAVLIVIEKTDSYRDLRLNGVWDLEARTIHVPYPVPRGAATRLVRYFRAGGDRAVFITTEPVGINRLYGNLRTAAHRIARDEVTVRRVDDGVQLMLIPKND